MELYAWNISPNGLTLHHLKSNIANIAILVEIIIA